MKMDPRRTHAISLKNVRNTTASMTIPKDARWSPKSSLKECLATKWDPLVSECTNKIPRNSALKECNAK